MNIEKRLLDLTTALEIEKQAEIDDYISLSTHKTIQDRVELGKTLYPLNYLGVKFSNFGDTILEFSIHENQSSSQFSNGSSVDLFNADGESAKGLIHYSKQDKLVVQTNSENSEKIEEWVGKGKIGLNLLPDSKTYDVFLDNLKSIKDSDFPFQIKQIYTPERTIIDVKSEYENSRLNESQTNAVKQIIEFENKVTIVHGPPGTGKTTTLVEAITELIRKGKKILVCAPTNAAVDNISQKLIENSIKVCRLGNPVKVDSAIQEYTLDYLAKHDSSFKLVETLKKSSELIRKKAFKFKRNFGKDEFLERKQLKYELKSIRKDIRKIQKDIYSTILEKSEVVAGTFIGVLAKELSKIEFDYVIVDEAGQAIEPAIWAVSKLANKLVLAGDEFQLPPFVQDKEAIKLGLNQSLLEIASKCNFPTDLLTVQYRMNRQIMQFSNHYFYKDKLTAALDVENWTLDNEIHNSIEFIDTAGCDYVENTGDTSYGLSNEGEIGVVAKRCLELDLVNNSFGIISPYRQQVKRMQSRFIDIGHHINTIDSFQGQERDIIILSLVRSNSESKIGFLKDYRRMNVAMTRARKKLIIIGDSATIGLDKYYAELLDYIEQKGTYRSAWDYFE